MRTLLAILFLPLVALAQPLGQQFLSMHGNSGLAIREVANNGGTTAAADPYNTSATFAIPVGRIGLAMVVNSKASAPDIPVFRTTNANTWIQIRTTNYNTLASPTCRLTVFYTISRDSSAALGSATFGASQTGCAIEVLDVAGADLTGTLSTNAFVQIVHGGNNANTNAVATLATISSARNLAIAWVGGSLNSANFVAESGWTKLSDQNYNTPTTEAGVFYQLRANDTSVLVTNAASFSWAAVAVEIKQQ